MQPIYTKNRVIGLLGGSFNPAHSGHLHISEYALKAMGFDAVWWLVSPQNPLKDASSLAEFEKRFASAQKITAHNKRILVSDIERRIKTNYTYHTISYLKKHYPGTHFVWLMGADNLAGFHRWQRRKDICKLLPIIVFDRAPYSFSSLSSKTYITMKKFLVNNQKFNRRDAPPSLRFIHLKRDKNSATEIRKTLGKKAFPGHN